MPLPRLGEPLSLPEPLSLVYVTASSRDEAMSLGRALVVERLAACANVIPGVRSIYEWQGELVESDEAVLLLKTPSHSVAVLIERVVALHSYDVPCVVALSLEQGYAPFLDWIVQQTRSAV